MIFVDICSFILYIEVNKKMENNMMESIVSIMQSLTIIALSIIVFLQTKAIDKLRNEHNER
jgi:EamA domain-containing membrane protein RarD